MIFRLLTFLLIPFFVIAGHSNAQNTAFNLADDYELIIDGDSNARDWDAKATRMEANFVLNGFNGNSLDELRPEHFNTLELRIPVGDLDSDSRRLNRNLHNYLKEDDHPLITFELQEINSIDSNGSNAAIYATGRISAAGVSNTVEMEVTTEINGNGDLIFSGIQPLLMTDFGIEPPSAMLGAIRARDEMDIRFTVRFTN